MIAFDAVHEGLSHEDGLATDEAEFRGLAARLELAVGAPVLLLHNLAVEHGLINGSQGKIVEIFFSPATTPTTTTSCADNLITYSSTSRSTQAPAFLPRPTGARGFLCFLWSQLLKVKTTCTAYSSRFASLGR